MSAKRPVLTNGGGEEGTYVTSTDISIPVMKIRNFNPAVSTDEDIYQMTKLVYNSLVGLSDTMEPQAELAESWSYENPGEIVFQLKKGVRFSDGSRSYGQRCGIFRTGAPVCRRYFRLCFESGKYFRCSRERRLRADHRTERCIGHFRCGF